MATKKLQGIPFDETWKGDHEENTFLATELRANEKLTDPFHTNSRPADDCYSSKWASDNKLRYLHDAEIWKEEELLEIYYGGLLRQKELYQAQRQYLWLELKEEKRKHLQDLLEASNQKTITPNLLDASTAPQTREESILERIHSFKGEEGLVARTSLTRMAELSIEKLNREKPISKNIPGPSTTALDYLEYTKFLNRIQNKLNKQTSGQERCKVKNCEKPHIPRSNFCIEHIMKDPEQCLFTYCTHESNDTTCSNIIHRGNTQMKCTLHQTLPDVTHLDD